MAQTHYQIRFAEWQPAPGRTVAAAAYQSDFGITRIPYILSANAINTTDIRQDSTIRITFQPFQRASKDARAVCRSGAHRTPGNPAGNIRSRQTKRVLSFQSGAVAA